ncbi:MAG: 30S ribosome-binding factor RbfA [Chromatiales bacterium]|jgi:ribosome-binding factor A
MAREFPRSLRIAEQIRRELAVLVRRVKDPRVGMVTFGEVEVSRDLGHAKVYFTVLGAGLEDSRACEQGLNHAAGFLRRELGKVMHVRSVPELRFVYDEMPERGSRLAALIDEAVRSDRSKSEDDPDHGRD